MLSIVQLAVAIGAQGDGVFYAIAATIGKLANVMHLEIRETI